LAPVQTEPKAIGLALSGGGARAIAFHLGCLRAVNQLGILDRVAVLSTVSGGSVIGACFHSHKGDFASFEAKIRGVLAEGLVEPMRRGLFSLLGLKVAAAFIVVGRHGDPIPDVRLQLRESKHGGVDHLVDSLNDKPEAAHRWPCDYDGHPLDELDIARGRWPDTPGARSDG